MTGNKKPCASFNDVDLAILRIFKESPSFHGIEPEEYDTPIVMKKTDKKATDTNARIIRAKVVAETENITQAINTGE